MRVALVTGGSRGIGLGISRALAADGLALCVNGVRPASEVAPVLEELRGSAPAVEYFRADISVADERDRMLSTIREKLGRLDVLVNNAGIAPLVRADILDAGEESFDRLMAVNLKGPYFLTQAVANWMIEQKRTDAEARKCVVNVTSISATAASVNRGEYCLSKAAMSMSSKLWAVRLSEFGIPVYEVRPGIVRTDMTAGVTEKYDRLIANGLLLEPRWGMPEDVGRAVAMLVRGDLPYSTGAVLTLDGGMSVERL